MGTVINYEDKFNKLTQMFLGGYLSSKHKKQYLKLASWKVEHISKLDDEALLQMVSE